MSLDSLKITVRQYLATQHMFVDEDWLSGCVEYLSEENSGENNIKILAKEQWLLNDLKDICPGSLPANLKSQTKTELTGRFVLQINAAIDIGTPAYQQYLKLQKVNMENVDATTKFEDKISSHRMIKLYLTDGVQEITAIEYKPMRNISCDITPGCKVLIKGPVVCRRGMLLLTEPAVELLGGEVQEIAVSNSLPGLLSAKLGVTITQESDLTTTNRDTHTTVNHTLSLPTHTPPSLEQSRPVARVTSVQQSEFNDEDIDIDQLAAIEEEIINISGSPDKRPFSDNPRTSDAMNRNSFGNTNDRLHSDSNNPMRGQFSDNSSLPPCGNPTDIDFPVKRSSTELTHNQIKKQKTLATNTAEDYPDDIDLLLEDDEYLREIETKIDASKNQSYNAKKTVQISSEPFVYIRQINDMIEKAGKVFRVKGQIMKLLSKLSVGKEGWSLKCTIVDGTGSLDVEFTSDVLSKLVGYTPQEMNLLKKQMAAKPELKEKAVAALQKARDNLQILYCIIELTFLEVLKITKLIPFDESHVEQLNKRMVCS